MRSPTPGAFYLPLATGDYTNIKIGVNSGSVNKTIDYGSLTMQKALVIGIPIFNRDGNLYYLSSDGKFNINGHKFIDLGLPSGTLWAECNVGAGVSHRSRRLFRMGRNATEGIVFLQQLQMVQRRLPELHEIR